MASKVNKKENGSFVLHMIELLEKDSLVSLLEFFESRVYLNNSVLFVVRNPHCIGHLENGFKVFHYCWQVLETTTAHDSSEGCVVVTHVEPKHLFSVYCFQFLF